MYIEETALLTEAIKAMTIKEPNEWIPVIAAIGGAVIGSLSSLVPTIFIESKREKVFSQQITKCLLAEISALMRLIEVRRIIDNIEDAISHLKNNPNDTYIIASEIPLHYSLVYQENCRHLGAVDKQVAQQIIHFYHLIDAVVQDIKYGGTFSKAPTIDGYKETLEILVLAVNIGRNLEKTTNSL
ncbi:hypothetical protein [Aeromonas dhakensis]|uniref:hypothetical protein n=1 Tax=Aeromonas dhakensis TaxID=196024 RepID=UPI002441BA16|nr:hypothetical protein [Aeromonas dhakensis]